MHPVRLNPIYPCIFGLTVLADGGYAHYLVCFSFCVCVLFCLLLSVLADDAHVHYFASFSFFCGLLSVLTGDVHVHILLSFSFSLFCVLLLFFLLLLFYFILFCWLFTVLSHSGYIQFLAAFFRFFSLSFILFCFVSFCFVLIKHVNFEFFTSPL